MTISGSPPDNWDVERFRLSFIAIVILGVVGAIGVPFFIAKNLQLGGYAKSPQEVRLGLGSTAVVAGGRAKLWYAGGDTGGDFEIQCATGTQYCQPSPGSEHSGCGIKVQLIEIEDKQPPFARFRVTW